MSRFENKVVMVTGAAGNLGHAVALEFLNEGAKLILTDHKLNRLTALFPTISQDKHLLADSINSINSDQVSEIIQRAVNKFNRIDVLVNTIGGYRAGLPVHKVNYDEFNSMIDLNLKTAVLACQQVAPLMISAKNGKIINVGSRAGLKGAAGAAAYSISKAAVIRMTESLSAELRAYGVNVNCVLPGIIDTPQNRQAMPNAQFTNWVTPKSIARVIVFLASGDANDIHGASIPVYGLT